jgi:superfamily II DNA/RNA helicase
LAKGGGDGGNRHNVVVATDVAARGLDWTNVQTIVHYDAARTIDGFVHRAGRTAVRVRAMMLGSFVNESYHNWDESRSISD